MKAVFITGSRDDAHARRVRDAVRQAIEGADCIYHGACPTGVDALAQHLAYYEVEIPATGVPARGKRDGWPQAGPIRNRRLAARAASLLADGNDVTCYAFPALRSPGTQNCIEVMRAAGVRVIVFGEQQEAG